VVIPDYLNFSSITFIINLQRHQNYYDKKFEVLEMVKSKLLELKLQNFCAGVPNGSLARKWFTCELILAKLSEFLIFFVDFLSGFSGIRDRT